MMQHEFEECWRCFCDLWPKTTEKMTSEQKDSYKRVMDRYRATQVIPVIRGLAENVTTTPRPSAVKEQLRREFDTKTTYDGIDVRAQNIRWFEHMARVDKWIKAQTPAYLKAAKKQLLAEKPYLKIYKESINKSVPWKTMIYEWVGNQPGFYSQL